MKLVLQITGGIVLASLILTALWVGVVVGVPAYAKYKAEQTISEHQERMRAKEPKCHEGEWIIDCISRPDAFD